MSGKSIISNSYLEDIGDAIRYKKGTDETFYPSQMGDAIRSIEGIVPTGTIEIDANGVYDVTEKAEVDVNVVPDLRPLSVSENGQYSPDGFDGYDSVTVDVQPELTSLSVTENGLYLPESGVDGYDRVSVDVPQPSGSTTITQNGTFNVEQYAEAVVDVPSAEWTTAGIADGSEPNGDIDLGDVETVTPYAFFNRPIANVHGKAVITLGNYAFNSCKSLVSVVLPYSNCGQQSFTECSALKNLHLPRATSIQTSGVVHTGLEFLFLPSLRTVGSYCMQSNALLETVILPECTSLNSNSTFNSCAKLTTVVLGGSAVIPIGANSFNNTPLASGGIGGHVYIRKSLYDHLGDGTAQDYLKNANWNTLNGYGTITWHPIEGSEYETYMPGGAKYEEEMALT